MADYSKYFLLDRSETSLREKAIHGAGAVVFARVSTYAVQLIGAIILARILTPSDFGLVAMITIITNILVEFGLLRLNGAVIQAEHISHSQVSTLFWINVLLCLGLTLLLVALAPVVARFYDEPRLTSITMIISVGFIFNGLSLQHIALLQRNMLFGRFAVIQIAAVITRDIIAIVMALNGWGYWALVTRYVLLQVGIAIGSWLLCGWRPGWPIKHSGVGPLVRFGINSLGNYSTDYVNRSLDKLLIGWRLGAQSLGFYDRAYQLFVMPASQLTGPLTTVAMATLSRLRDNPERYRNYYLNAVSAVAFVGMAISLFLFLIGKDIVLLLLGPRWETAGEIFSIFGPAIGIMLIYRTHGWLHLSLGRADRFFRWGIIAMIVTAISFVSGLPFGAKGVAAAYSLSFYILIGPGLWYAGRPVHIRFRIILSVIWRYFVAATMACITYWSFLYALSCASGNYADFDIIKRIVFSSAILILLYLFFVIILHWSLKPITQFLSILREMLPRPLFSPH